VPCCGPQIADPAKLDAIFVPIGGGGLIAGIAAYVKVLHPHIQVRPTLWVGKLLQIGNCCSGVEWFCR